MKIIYFLLCIFLVIYLSACRLKLRISPPFCPVTPPNLRIEWINLVSGKRIEHSEFKNETIVFDDKGDLVWTISGTEHQYYLVLIHNDTHAVYQSSWGYTGVAVKDNRLLLYSQHVEKVESIDWETTRWIFGTLNK